jgi:hypothetical protein
VILKDGSLDLVLNHCLPFRPIVIQISLGEWGWGGAKQERKHPFTVAFTRVNITISQFKMKMNFWNVFFIWELEEIYRKICHLSNPRTHSNIF